MSDTVLKIIRVLAKNYNMTLDQDHIDLYQLVLGDLSDEVLMQTMRLALCENTPWMPKPGQLLDLSKTAKLRLDRVDPPKRLPRPTIPMDKLAANTVKMRDYRKRSFDLMASKSEAELVEIYRQAKTGNWMAFNELDE